MKKNIIPLIVLTLVSFNVMRTGLTDEERAFAISEMTKSHNYLLDEVEGLSEAQLNFKSSPDSWSIAECVEHITISENTIFTMLEGALKTPADASKRREVKMTDNELLTIIKDRSNKVKTSKPFEPTGKYGSYEETLKVYISKRSMHIDYAKTTKDDLRNHYGQLPFGTVDAFQIILFMSGHTHRHTAQITEVKAHADFPKK